MSAVGESNPLAISGLVVLTLIWSCSWIFMKQVTSYIGAFGFIVLRYILGALVLFTTLLLRGYGMRPVPFKYTLATALLRICGMVGLAQWVLVSGEVRKVAVLSRTMSSWIVTFAVLFLDEHLQRGQYSTILVVTFGLFLVLQPWQLDFSSMKSAMPAVLSGVSWGANTTAVKRLHAHHPRVDLLSLTSQQMLYATLATSVVVLLVPQREIDWQPTVFWTPACSAILMTVLAWSLWLFVLENLPASIASLNTLAVPVCGVLSSWWLLSKNPRTVEGSGAVLIVLVSVSVSRKRKEAVSVERI